MKNNGRLKEKHRCDYLSCELLFMENHFYLKEWLTNYQVKIKNLENLYLSLWALAVSQDFYDKKGSDNIWCFDIT